MAVGDYEFGNQAEPDNDQRREFRLTGRVTVTLELEAADPDQASGPRVLHCYSSDLSAGGIRVISSEPVTPGALIPAYVELVQNRQETVYPLTVEAVWCREQEPGQWQVGLHVVESDDTAVLEWLETMVRALDDD